MRKSHWTNPSLRASAGRNSINVRRAKACVSIVSLYQSQPLSSGAQLVPSSGVVLALSMTLSQTRAASFTRPARFSVSDRNPLRYGEWSFQCLNEKSSILVRSPFVNTPPVQVASGKLLNV